VWAPEPVRIQWWGRGKWLSLQAISLWSSCLYPSLTEVGGVDPSGNIFIPSFMKFRYTGLELLRGDRHTDMMIT